MKVEFGPFLRVQGFLPFKILSTSLWRSSIYIIKKLNAAVRRNFVFPNTLAILAANNWSLVQLKNILQLSFMLMNILPPFVVNWKANHSFPVPTRAKKKKTEQIGLNELRFGSKTALWALTRRTNVITEVPKNQLDVQLCISTQAGLMNCWVCP